MKIKHQADILKTIFEDVLHQMKTSNILLVASSLAYTTILSLIPLLALSFSIFQAFGGLENLNEIIVPFILKNLTAGSSEEVVAILREFIFNTHSPAIGIWGFVGLIVTSMIMIASIDNAILQIWQIPMGRKIFQRISAYWLIITLGPLIIGATAAITRVFPLGMGFTVTMAVGFIGLYKWVPNTRVEWRYAIIAGVVVALLWNIARWGFVLYTQKVITYSKIYGSLGAIPIFLLWIYIAWLTILSGAALSAALQLRLEQKN
jgi:membrane protein